MMLDGGDDDGDGDDDDEEDEAEAEADADDDDDDISIIIMGMKMAVMMMVLMVLDGDGGDDDDDDADDDDDDVVMMMMMMITVMISAVSHEVTLFDCECGSKVCKSIGEVNLTCACQLLHTMFEAQRHHLFLISMHQQKSQQRRACNSPCPLSCCSPARKPFAFDAGLANRTARSPLLGPGLQASEFQVV